MQGPWAVQENRPPREDLREDASRTEDRADRVPQGSRVRSELLKIELKVFYNIDTEWDVVVLSFKESNFENQIAAGIMCWDINTLFKEFLKIKSQVIIKNQIKEIKLQPASNHVWRWLQRLWSSQNRPRWFVFQHLSWNWAFAYIR